MSDPNKYIDENFSKETAIYVKHVLKERIENSKKVTKEELDATITNEWEIQQ